MSGADDDKTRHRNPATGGGSGDATRIAPPKNPPGKPADDLTRIATAGARPLPVQAGAAAPKAEGDGATRLRPPAPASGAANDGTTRIAPPRQSPKAPSDPTAAGRRQGILKNRFVLEKTLGGGGMGVVYKAKDLLKVEAQDRDPYIAIKVLSEEFKSHPNAFIALQRETRTSHRIAHPNIVNVHDFDRDGDIVYMTMEYMEGQSLDKLIRQYKSTGLPTDDAWHILKGMCGALMHAHHEKVIHSDFKPGNVFVTNKGTAKVFDFGIARAVARAHKQEDRKDDRTVFDAGTLGALTPAYASLEMLQGQPPDVRDDIYALGCVAYEIFCGEHPFQKVPADEAARLKLTPKRIPQISKRQWKVLEKALAFRREDRVQTVEAFLKGMTAVYAPAYKAITIAVLLAIIFGGGLYLYLRPAPVPVSTDEIRNELERKLRLGFEKQALADLMNNADFTPGWEEQLAAKVAALHKLLPNDDPWLQATIASIYEAYLKKIAASRGAGDYATASRLIKNAAAYAGDVSRLDEESALLADAMERDRLRQQEATQQRVTTAQDTKQRVEARRQKTEFDVALENVNDQLACGGKLNMRNVATAIAKLRSIDVGRYGSLEPRIVSSLASCITEIGKSFPESADDSKKYAMRIFPNNRIIAGISIVPRDPCNASLAGQGARSDRTVCRDKLAGGGVGPVLVVIPAGNGVRAFAIGKYEVSLRELNQFCRQSGSCRPDTARDEELPATGISIRTAEEYVRWLTGKTDRKYRLPTVNEWEQAARAGGGPLDANRNCRISTRGITRGDGLLSAVAGRQNNWGLVNAVGNAQEWAYGEGKRIMALGGSYEQPLDTCTTESKVPHGGNADRITGFRMVRELVR